MNFEVKYRNKQGEVEVLVLDVASKSEVWPILKERGISAISVTASTGKKRKPAAKKTAAARKTTTKKATAAKTTAKKTTTKKTTKKAEE